MARKKKSLLRKKIKRSVKKISKIKKSLRRKPTSSWKLSGKPSLLVKNPSNDQILDSCKKGRKLVYCKDLSDAELVTVIKKQAREAYRELFLRYHKKLFTFIFHLVGNKDETEDILQNVFSKTYKNIKNFDTSRKFSSWIYRIAHNEAVNFLKRKSKRYTVSWDDISTSKDKLDTATNDELPEDKWAHQEITREIDDALEKLSKKYQQILKLRYFQELSYEDISAMLGKPVNTVGTLINRAKKKLLEVVKKQGNRK
jgi:RNA polymerase sigma-70 factor, ECF subfamily